MSHQSIAVGILHSGMTAGGCILTSSEGARQPGIDRARTIQREDCKCSDSPLASDRSDYIYYYLPAPPSESLNISFNLDHGMLQAAITPPPAAA
jgi:hypothetical protein